MKKILLLISFSFLNSFAMETGEETITLVSAQGHEFPVSASAVLRSHTIANMRNRGEFQGEIPGLFSEAKQNQVPLNEISTETLKNLIPLLLELNRLLQKNEQTNAINKQIYIPRKYQPFVNENLKSISPTQTAALYQAADFLDLPFIINAIASLVANRIVKEIPERWDWDKLDQVRQKEIVAGKATQMGITLKHEYILKHVMLRQAGIEQEYSIADYIADYGQPQLKNARFQKMLSFCNQKITSLFGMNFIQVQTDTKSLEIYGAYLYDISLDVQRAQAPFQGFTQVETFLFEADNLISLPLGIFSGLDQLKTIALSCNKLETLPDDLFDDLPRLQDLSLSGNKFSKEEQEQIKKRLPDINNIDF